MDIALFPLGFPGKETLGIPTPKPAENFPV
jgi:hypothetical protein